MSAVQGYSHVSALAKVPDAVRDTLRDAVGTLSEIGVSRLDGTTSAVKAAPDAETIGAQKDRMKTDLVSTLGRKDAKAEAILGKFSAEALNGEATKAFSDRLAGLTQKEQESLKSSLHYGGLQWPGTAGERLSTRTAVALAFAQGASVEDVATLRAELDKAKPETRANVLAKLNAGQADATGIISSLGNPDAPPPSSEVRSRTVLDDGDRADLNAYLSRDVNYPLHEDLGTYYFDRNLQATVDANDPEELATVRLGCATITCYTGTEFYGEINDDLREHARSGKAVRDETALFTKAACAALAKMPDFQGIVIRGGGSGWEDVARKTYTPGATVTEPTFVSSSANKGFPGTIQFVIESRHGKEVTNLSSQDHTDGREVLFPPNTKFQVLDRAEHGGQIFIVMKEVD